MSVLIQNSAIIYYSGAQTYEGIYSLPVCGEKSWGSEMSLQGNGDDFLPSRDPYSLSKCLGSLGSPGGGFCRLPNRPLLYSLKRMKVFVLSQQFSLFLSCGEIYQAISRYPPRTPQIHHTLTEAGRTPGGQKKHLHSSSAEKS